MPVQELLRVSIGGVDVSGNNQGQHNHVARIVGKEDAVNRIYNKIGVSPIHMSEMSEWHRLQVRNNLDLSSSEISAWCFHINRRMIEADILEYIRLGGSRMPKINVHKSFEMYWFGMFHNDLKSFVARFRMDLSEVVIQADNDMSPTLESWRIASKHKGKVHEISDAVAWFNQKDIKIRDCKTVDLRDRIRKCMMQGLQNKKPGTIGSKHHR